ncbi:hypothetical protein Bbelb_312690 [Branchiostoma belcheri]|nr:hypothetical protein Bbelb_312690 [Branchiostoma belcheri]
MAEDLNADSVPNDVRNDSFSDSTTEPGTRTVPPTVRQTNEDVNNYISGTCEENEHDDDEHLSIQSCSAFENRETIRISPGDFDTYAIAYTCKAHDTCIKKNVEERQSKPFQGSNTASSNHNENDIHLAGCGSAQSYTDTFIGNDGNMRIKARNPNPMYTHKTVNPHQIHAENKVFPNPMYQQSTTEISNASHGSAFKPSEPYQEINNSRTQAMDSNPMCTHNTTTPYPLHPKNDVNPDRAYTHLQNTIEPSNASPGSTFLSSMLSSDVPCTLTSADTQNNLECNAALSDTQPKLPSQDLPSAASNNNDVLSNPLSNINGVLNALNPNPIYVPNVQNSAACAFDVRGPSLPVSLRAVDYRHIWAKPEVSGNGVSHEPGDVSWPTYKWNMVATMFHLYPFTPGWSEESAFPKCLSQWHNVGAHVQTCPGYDSESNPGIPVAALSPRSQQSPTPHNVKLLRNGGTISAVETATLQEMGGPLSVTLTVPGRVALRATGVETLQLTVTVLAVSIIITQVESGDRKLENIITIGGDGKEPIIREAYGVAVSADNEIFVTGFNKVQVFSIKGNYLRLFQTIMPGENVFIVPVDLAIGIEPGHLWVVGPVFNSGAHEGHVQVVKYSRIGQIMKKFDLGFTKHYIPPVIAVDVRNNKIIIGQGNTDKLGNIIVADNENNRVDMFTSRGEFVRTIANIRSSYGIAMGPDGEMVVTTTGSPSTVTIFPHHKVLP